jgi:hypothetical protein
MEKNTPAPEKFSKLIALLEEEAKKELEELNKRREKGPDGKVTPYPQKKYNIKADLD